ncbi:MAG: glycosyltransferase family 2 protein [Pyrinomonadaceae bacterium]
MKISVAIITLNEEANIGRALRSVEWADEILVLDSGSSDRTEDIVRDFGARFEFNEWNGFSKQKQKAADLCGNEWILSIDADEEVTEALATEIKDLLKSDPDLDGFKIPRLSIYMDREIRHSGWYPDHQLRLFRKSKGHWKERLIHESFEMADGSTAGVLSNDLLHFSVHTPIEHHRMIGDRYALLGAKQALSDGKRSGPVKTVVAPVLAFSRSYLLKLGFLDGFPGFCIAFFSAYHAFLKNLLMVRLPRETPTAKADGSK